MSCAMTCQPLPTPVSRTVVLPNLAAAAKTIKFSFAPINPQPVAKATKPAKTALKSQYVDGLVSVIAADKGHDNAEYISCGRRIFLACLMTAHKYLMDRTYKNVAWAKVSGLPIAEVNRAERVVLELLDWRLGVAPDAWDQWCKMIEIHVQLRTGANQYNLVNNGLVDVTSASTVPKIEDGFLLCQSEPRTMADLSITVMSQDNRCNPIHPDSAVVLACDGFSPQESANKKRKSSIDQDDLLPSPKRSC